MYTFSVCYNVKHINIYTQCGQLKIVSWYRVLRLFIHVWQKLKTQIQEGIDSWINRCLV